MASSPHPLESLVGALRYASARDFANLRLVKDLRTPLAAALERSKAVVSEARRSVLEQAARSIDSADETQRRAAVLSVLGVMRAEGLTVDFAPAGAVTATGPAAGPTSPVVERAVPVAKTPPAATRAPSVKAAAGKARKKKKDAEEDENSQAKILSIGLKEGVLSDPVKTAGKLSPRLVGLLNKKGILKIADVLFLLPRVYEDRREMKKIAQLRSGERGTIVAEVKRVEETYGRGRQFRAILGDSSGSIAASYFQSGPWLKAKFPIGKRLVVSGEVRQSPWGWEMTHPEVEPAEDLETSPVHFNRIVPVYPGFERHEQRALRQLAFTISGKHAKDLEDPLPGPMKVRLDLLDLGSALERLHFPPGDSDLAELNDHRSPAHHRLAFDELFFLQLGMALRRQGVKIQPGIAFTVDDEKVAKAKALLSFVLTGAQQRVVGQILKDMARPEPMNRLVQGDVGSGKTAVAMIAASVALQNGYQVAVMAPTEILAEQHHRTFSKWFAPMGLEVALLTGSGPAKEKAARRQAVASGKVRIAVGTHALIQGEIAFEKLGFVVIDEQHRFGVIQRHALMAKGALPDVLVMTATPIPRTLAMTLYGDLDVSVIDELPPGRTPIVTKVYMEKGRPRAYEQVRGELARGHQVYVVYPLVEESEKLDLADATQGAEQLKAVFPEARIGLLHGRMKAEEKEAVMGLFRAHELDLLVSTTVIEVGVDVPNASVMVIEHAERFGLSQLHQLRGRVGRGAAKSFCVLISGYALSEDSRERLAVMEQSSDGFVIAERDLELRGPGEFLGTRQSGMPELAVANLVRDQALLAQAQEEARAIIQKDPSLQAPEHRGLVKALEERWQGRLKLATVG